MQNQLGSSHTQTSTMLFYRSFRCPPNNYYFPNKPAENQPHFNENGAEEFIQITYEDMNRDGYQSLESILTTQVVLLI